MPPPSTLTSNTQDGGFKRVSYFHMEPKTKVRLCQIEGHLCTHLILAFAQIDTMGHLTVSREDDFEYLNQVKEFKHKFSSVKVLISVLNGFQNIVGSNAVRQKFSKSVIEFLQRYHLDGLDLNWQFPNFPTSFLGTKDFERSELTKIIKALRSAIVENFYDRQLAEQHELKSHLYSRAAASVNFSSAVEPHLLTVAIAGQESVLRASYELRQLANLCDWLNVMSFDYFLFKAYAPFTGPNSPLYPIVDHYVPILSKLSLSWTVTRLLEEGLPNDKIVMGIPTYARAYKLAFKHTSPSPFALSVGSRGGQFDDYLSYREVIDILRRDDTKVEFDSRARVPYLLTDNGYTWISYENIKSVREKVFYILQQNLGGYMTWNLNCDSFTIANSHINSGKNYDEDNIELIASSDNEISRPMSPLKSFTSSTPDMGELFPLHSAMLNEVTLFFTNIKSLEVI